jgi:hypothetical protein
MPFWYIISNIDLGITLILSLEVSTIHTGMSMLNYCMCHPYCYVLSTSRSKHNAPSSLRSSLRNLNPHRIYRQSLPSPNPCYLYAPSFEVPSTSSTEAQQRLFTNYYESLSPDLHTIKRPAVPCLLSLKQGLTCLQVEFAWLSGSKKNEEFPRALWVLWFGQHGMI